MSDREEAASERLPEGVREMRSLGGTAYCRGCGYSVRFEGNESRDEAGEMWYSDEHRQEHSDDGPEIRADGGVGQSGKEQSGEIIVDPEEFDEPPITMECPECGTSGDVPGAWEGLTIECKTCGERFPIRDEAGDSDE